MNDPAKPRFFIIQAARWGGMVAALVGLLATYGRLAIPQPAGIAIVAIGLLAALVLPSVLTSKWKSRDE